MEYMCTWEIHSMPRTCFIERFRQLPQHPCEALPAPVETFASDTLEKAHSAQAVTSARATQVRKVVRMVMEKKS